eukprot:1376842-Amorphochlora_amoeboformis.AAC.1
MLRGARALAAAVNEVLPAFGRPETNTRVSLDWMPLTYLGLIEVEILESRTGEVLTVFLESFLADAGSAMEVLEQRKRCELNIFRVKLRLSWLSWEAVWFYAVVVSAWESVSAPAFMSVSERSWRFLHTFAQNHMDV